jgi:hypothetical protein
VISGIAGPNPSEDRDVRLLCLLCCVSSALWDDLITRLNESSEVCACVSNVYDLEISTMRWPRPELGCCASGEKIITKICHETQYIYLVTKTSSHFYFGPR